MEKRKRSKEYREDYDAEYITEENAETDWREGTRRRERRGLAIRVIASAAGLAAVFFLGTLASRIYYDRKEEASKTPEPQALSTAEPALTQEEQEALYRSMKEEAQQEAPGQGEPQIPQTQTDSKSPIDFSYLWTVNEDIYAWITIPGTNIDYPILQHPTDDTYYLNHNLDGSYGFPACIYTESLNSKDFTDPNTVIYGHNLKAKTMFTELHKFEGKDFFEEHNEVIIYLPDRTLHYRVFAAHVYDDRHLMYSFDFSDEAVFREYLESIYDIRDMSANIDRESTVTETDRIITMSTCMPNKADAEKRLLVHAVFESEEPAGAGGDEN